MNESQIKDRLSKAKAASFQLAGLTDSQRNEILSSFVELIEKNEEALLKANAQDLKREKGRLSDPLYKRLKYDSEKSSAVIRGIYDLIQFADPLGETTLETLVDEGLLLKRVTVPLGLVCIIFESRPDVAPQLMGLALKTGNALVLKGGQEAREFLQAFEKIALELSKRHKFLPKEWVTFLYSREDIRILLDYPEFVDLVVPRGSNKLVQSIQKATQIPVLGHADGVCHLYVHESTDIESAIDIALDSKIQSPAACNALETLLVDAAIAKKFLPLFGARALEKEIKLFGCPNTRKILRKIGAVKSWHQEFGDLRLNIRVVRGVEEAIQHINEFGSHHTDAILSEDEATLQKFRSLVDSACVFINTSTRFSDGYRFGFGAEVGISTSKTHARGPVGIEGLLSYKYILDGQGQKVSDYSGAAGRRYLHRRMK